MGTIPSGSILPGSPLPAKGDCFIVDGTGFYYSHTNGTWTAINETSNIWKTVEPNGNGDYTHIQSALDAGEKRIWLFPGTYDETITIRNSDVTLAGTREAIIEPASTDGSSAVTLDGSSAQISNIKIGGFSINVPATTYLSVNGIDMSPGGITNLIIEDMHIHGPHQFPNGGAGAIVAKSAGQVIENVLIRGCRLESWDRTGIELFSAGAQITQVRILDNYFYDYITAGIRIYDRTQHVVIANNTFKTNAQSTSTPIVDSATKSIMVQGASNTTHFVSIANNVIHGGGIGNGYGIYIGQGNVDHVVASGNILTSCNTCFYVTNTSFVTITGNDNNEVWNSDGIRAVAPNSHLVIGNNQINS